MQDTCLTRDQYFLTLQDVRNKNCGPPRTIALKETLSELTFRRYQASNIIRVSLSGPSFSWFSSFPPGRNTTALFQFCFQFVSHPAAPRCLVCVSDIVVWRKWIECVKIARTQRSRHLWWYEKLNRRLHIRCFCVTLYFRLIIQGVLFIVLLITATAARCAGECSLFTWCFLLSQAIKATPLYIYRVLISP
jgi:hypothetical protein